jgi:hypothetical protein
MARLVTLLIMFAFVFTNGPAVAMAMCQHNDAKAHAAALLGADAGLAAIAQAEETAANTASQQGALGDAAMTLMAGFLLPPETHSFPLRSTEPANRHSAHPVELASRSVPPLLEPPSA